MTDKIEELKNAIANQENYMCLQEMSNDSYFISSAYKEDEKYLNLLKQKLKQESK